MYKLLFPIVFILFIACKQTASHSDDGVEEATTEVISQPNTNHPEELQKVFEAHGGWDTWTKQESLQFSMEGRGGVETHTISLKDRSSLIKTDTWSIGYDGKDVWLQQQDSTAYKGSARFYHNLMFYFYVMPFVLGDDGIQYEILPETELMGEKYGAIKISYDAGIGDTPNDEYILYYDPETHQMSWLAYTVTFGKEGKSDTFSYIKYAEWDTFNKLILPTKIVWHEVVNGKPIKASGERVFTTISISEQPISKAIFTRPENSEIVPMI